MENWAKLIEAIAGLIGALAWPIAVVMAVWLIMRRYQEAFGRLIDRVKMVSYPGGQIDLIAMEAAQRAQVDELVEQASEPTADDDQRRAAVGALRLEAERLGQLQAARTHTMVRCPNSLCRAEFYGRFRSGVVKCPQCLMTIPFRTVMQSGEQPESQRRTRGWRLPYAEDQETPPSSVSQGNEAGAD